jgi:hypothetical protein
MGVFTKMKKAEINKIQERSKDKIERTLVRPGWSRLTLVFILVVLLWNSFQIMMMSGVVSKVDKYNQGVVDEMGGLVGDVKVFAQDLNEIRRFLLLPEKTYTVAPEQEKTAADESENSENSVAVFAFLNSLEGEEKELRNREAARPVFESILSGEGFLPKLQQAQLVPGVKGDLQIKFTDGQKVLADGGVNVLAGEALYNLVFDAAEKVFKIQSALEEKKYSLSGQTGLSAAMADYMVNNLGKVREKKLQARKEEQENQQKVLKMQQDELLKKKQELENTVHDKAFTETLAGIGLKVAEQPREESNKYIFDILDQQGKVKFSLMLEISSGMVKVLRNNQEIDIRTFLDDGSKKNF